MKKDWRTVEMELGKDTQMKSCCPPQGDAQPPSRALLMFGRYGRIRVRVGMGDVVNIFKVLGVVN